MGYYCDMGLISLDKFKSNLRSQRLLPSQQILLEDIDDKFERIKKQGINDLKTLSDSLKDKAAVKSLTDSAGLDVQYLKVLRREVSSYRPKARKIADFSMISPIIKQKLLDRGVKTTEQLFDYVSTKNARETLARDMEISTDEALILAKLCDVSRLRYVNCDFAQLLVNSTYDTVEKIKKADHIKLYEQLKALNQENRYYTGHIGPKDMDFLVRDKSNSEIVMEF